MKRAPAGEGRAREEKLVLFTRILTFRSPAKCWTFSRAVTTMLR